MKDLVWNNILSVQTQETDEDHQRPVDLFKLLNHAVAEEEKAEYVQAVLEALISCTVWHFRHEACELLKNPSFIV
jgi:hemerythrin